MLSTPERNANMLASPAKISVWKGQDCVLIFKERGLIMHFEAEVCGPLYLQQSCLCLQCAVYHISLLALIHNVTGNHVTTLAVTFFNTLMGPISLQ